MVKVADQFLVNRALMIIAYLYGWDTVSRFKGHRVEVEYNASLRRIRHVYVDGKVAFSIRASDGLLLPTIYGASFIGQYIKVNDETAGFVKQGRSVPAKGIIEIKGVVQFMDAPIVNESSEIVGVGRLMLMPSEVKTVSRGFVIKTRHHIKDN